MTLEFHPNDDAAVSLMELRFHIPPDPKDTEKDLVQEFYNNVLEKADIIQATGDALAVFTEVQCLTPRGRYDFKMYNTFLQLHGKTFDYKIPYTTVLRLFLLPHKDGRQMFFVISLDPPIKQGQTRYHFCILLFNIDDEMSIELGISDEDLQEKYDNKLQKEMSGAEYEVISRVFKLSPTAKSQCRAHSSATQSLTPSAVPTRQPQGSCIPWREASSLSTNPQYTSGLMKWSLSTLLVVPEQTDPLILMWKQNQGPLIPLLVLKRMSTENYMILSAARN